jgi:hypothetical protein
MGSPDAVAFSANTRATMRRSMSGPGRGRS